MTRRKGGEAVGTPSRRMVRGVWRVLRAVALVWFLCGLVLFLAQDWLIFPASSAIVRDPSSEGWPFEEVRLSVGEETTHAWYVPLKGARATVHFSHGNAGNVSHRMDTIRVFRELGLSVLIYDYGGYGESTGRPSEARCHADARAAWDWLTTEAGITPDAVIIAGRSLGGAVAARLASEVDAGCVVLESTFTSVPDMAWRQYPVFPVRWLVRHPFDTLSLIPEIDEPKLIIHSRADGIVPFEMGERLFDAATSPKAFLEIAGDHNRGFLASGSGYVEGLRAFLDRHTAGASVSLEVAAH